MIREVASEESGPIDLSRMASIAHAEADKDAQSYDGMGVGAAVSFRIGDGSGCEYVVYSGTNINISGMQTKRHAEQVALNQAILDYEMLGDDIPMRLDDVVVVTDGDDMDLVCGHCMQVVRSVCDYIGCTSDRVMYISAEFCDEDGEFKYDKYSLDELLGETYAE